MPIFTNRSTHVFSAYAKHFTQLIINGKDMAGLKLIVKADVGRLVLEQCGFFITYATQKNAWQGNSCNIINNFPVEVRTEGMRINKKNEVIGR